MSQLCTFDNDREPHPLGTVYWQVLWEGSPINVCNDCHKIWMRLVADVININSASARRRSSGEPSDSSEQGYIRGGRLGLEQIREALGWGDRGTSREILTAIRRLRDLAEKLAPIIEASRMALCERASTEFRSECGRDGAPEANWCITCRVRGLS